MRLREALWRGGVVVGWAGGLVLATVIDESLYFAVGVPLTLIAGAVLDRWWALAAPWAIAGVLFAIAYLSDPSCSDCGEDPWSFQLLFAVFFFALPASVLMGIGFAGRRLLRFFRDLPTGDDGSRQHA